jgi:hypothetical protein
VTGARVSALPRIYRTPRARRAGDRVDPVHGGLGDQDGHGHAALRLVERGEVRLHQPLTEVPPAEQQTAALTGAHTLHHMLSHTCTSTCR